MRHQQAHPIRLSPPNLGMEQVEQAYQLVCPPRADVAEWLRERAGYVTLADHRAEGPERRENR